MPQLDLLTFIDQTVCVYIFFIIQYIIISIFVLPGIYQVFALKRLLYVSALNDTKLGLLLLFNSLVFVNILELSFEGRIN